MTVDTIVRAVAGIFIMLTLALGVEASPLFVSTNWLWFTAFVGFNLFQSALTRVCPLEMILIKVGIGKTA